MYFDTCESITITELQYQQIIHIMVFQHRLVLHLHAVESLTNIGNIWRLLLPVVIFWESNITTGGNILEKIWIFFYHTGMSLLLLLCTRRKVRHACVVKMVLISLCGTPDYKCYNKFEQIVKYFSRKCFILSLDWIKKRNSTSECKRL